SSSRNILISEHDLFRKTGTHISGSCFKRIGETALTTVEDEQIQRFRLRCDQARANLAKLSATFRYTSRRNGTTRSGTRSSRSHRQVSNSAGWPLRGVSGSISSSQPSKRNANHFCRWPRKLA